MALILILPIQRTVWFLLFIQLDPLDSIGKQLTFSFRPNKIPRVVPYYLLSLVVHSQELLTRQAAVVHEGSGSLGSVSCGLVVV